jgi:hypothetical protein
MDEILQGLDGVQCVLDDMIITEKGDDEHLKILKMYFKGCRTMHDYNVHSIPIFCPSPIIRSMDEFQ